MWNFVSKLRMNLGSKSFNMMQFIQRCLLLLTRETLITRHILDVFLMIRTHTILNYDCYWFVPFFEADKSNQCSSQSKVDSVFSGDPLCAMKTS